MKILLLLTALVASLLSCKSEKPEKLVTPWGEIRDSIPENDNFDLDRIIANGEMIVLTISGPATFYDHRGRQLGLQYMMVQRYAESIGVGVRVELCRDTLEMVRKIISGDADVVAFPLKSNDIALSADSLGKLVFCGAGNDSIGKWLVNKEKMKLAHSLDEWYEPKIMAEVKKEESFLLSTQSVVRHVYAPMLNKKGGIISHYDALFMTYCKPIRWDWRLMAAQCYQESTFDPKARSWAGAQGLMQIMPSTADMLGLPRDKIYDPESNIAAAAKYLGQLEAKFNDVPSRYERMNFTLASYNGGYHHIRDAMALTEKFGGNPHSWNDVSGYVLKLSNPEFYRDPVVKYGYMRGSETEDYVRKIRQRWDSYKVVKSPRTGYSNLMPQKSKKHKKKYDV
ncbi:MAG: transglycosylase SLT domain-containing protein [Prevotella sp.]